MFSKLKRKPKYANFKISCRVLSYIVNLKPHDPKKTIGINHARKMVLQLAQPLAEIVQLIGDNIYELDQHTNQLLIENQSLEELKQKLHMPVIDIRVKELPQPVTVCTSPQCSAIYKVSFYFFLCIIIFCYYCISILHCMFFYVISLAICSQTQKIKLK